MRKVPRGYEVAYVHPRKEEAEKHARDLRRSHFGIMKRRIYVGVKIVPKPKGFAVLAKESKGWNKWLRTGKG